MELISIDPGPRESGWAIDINKWGVCSNNDLLSLINKSHTIIVEYPVIYKGAGSSIIDTAIEIGRFKERAGFCILISRQNVLTYVKKHGFEKNDSGVISFLKSKFPNIKMKSHAWQAFALLDYYKNI